MLLIETLFKSWDAINIFLRMSTKLTYSYKSGDPSTN